MRRSAVLALAALTLAACGGDPEEVAEPTPAAVEEEEVAEPTPAATAVEEAEGEGEGEAEVDEAMPEAMPEEEVPRYEPAECELGGPGIPEADECGWLVVPENRSDPDDTDTIRLHVAVFRSAVDAKAPDAMLYLHGGPGGPAIADMVPRVETFLEALAGDRDVVVFDQRGTGFSRPELSCPEVVDAQLEVVAAATGPEDAEATMTAAYAACRNRLIAAGVDLTAYNDAESAADVAALREALGYQEWNLLGGSYGTRLALSVLRYHPEGVRAVVLEGVEPPQMDLLVELVSARGEVFERLFAECAADDVCASAFPDLEQMWRDAVERHDADPVLVSLSLSPGEPAHDVLVDGDMVMAGISGFLADTQLIPIVPQIIAGLDLGVEEATQAVARNVLGFVLYPQFSHGAALSFQCHDDVALSDPATMVNAIDDAGRLGDALNGRIGRVFPDASDFYYRLCEQWGAGAADAVEAEPVVSDVPVLALNGTYDTLTPVSGARLAVEALPNSVLVEFPGFGHSVTEVSSCGLGIARAFLDDPRTPPQVGCVDDLTLEFATG